MAGLSPNPPARGAEAPQEEPCECLCAHGIEHIVVRDDIGQCVKRSYHILVCKFPAQQAQEMAKREFIPKQPILAVCAFRLCRQCHNFKVGEFWFGVATRNITLRIYEIIGKWLAYSKYFDEFCM